MTDPRLKYRIAFSSLRGLTPTLAGEILARVGDEEQFFTLSSDTLSAILGFRSKLFDRSVRDKALDEARRECDFVTGNSIRPLYFSDDDYPRRLRMCDDAPLMLYSLGDCRFNEARFISIVGTRHATAYGDSFVEDLVSSLSRECADPIVVVSGLAYGIDSSAHRAALSAGVPTVGVLAHGLNTIYPASHRDLAAQMVRNGGGLVTDYRSIDPIHKGNFLARNRIVAGMSDCLVVVESDTHGGALVTARLASDYSRDVFALPGRISDRYSRGCNRLISTNVAALVTSASDIIDAMRWPRREESATQPSLFPETDTDLSDDERGIIDILADAGQVTMPELRARVDIPLPRLMGMLIDLELRNHIIAIPGGRYMLR